MRAGVRPGLQILWTRLWRAGRFDSDTLPPRRSAGGQTTSKRIPEQRGTRYLFTWRSKRW